MSRKYKSNIEMIVDKPIILFDFLMENVEGKSRNNIKSLLRRGNIEVDRKRIKKYDYSLKVGQRVVIRVAQIYNKEHKERLNIIYEDDDFLVINKKAGLLSISTLKENSNTAYKMVSDYVKTKNPRLKIFVVHRLDRDTSGVMIFAKSEKIKSALQNNWSELVELREYIGIVEGEILKESGTVKSWLHETKAMIVYSSNKKEDGKEAITHYSKLKSNKKYTMLKIKIDTGRKNQIRVHMKDIGHSIVGDKKYGSTVDPLKRLGLHAHVLEFKHPVTNRLMHFEADFPKRFKTLLK